MFWLVLYNLYIFVGSQRHVTQRLHWGNGATECLGGVLIRTHGALGKDYHLAACRLWSVGTLALIVVSLVCDVVLVLRGVAFLAKCVTILCPIKCVWVCWWF